MDAKRFKCQTVSLITAERDGYFSEEIQGINPNNTACLTLTADQDSTYPVELEMPKALKPNASGLYIFWIPS
jgi:hypothetical protein